MFTKYFILDDELSPLHLEDPRYGWEPITSFKDVKDAFNKLDGSRISILVVAEDRPAPDSGWPYSGRAMSIGGGKNNEYIGDAYLIPGDDKASSLYNRDEKEPDALVEVKHGQVESFRKRFVVGREAVLKALKTFVESGELDKQLTWEVT